MQFKTPLKIKILILNFKDDYFDGKIAIHENEYKIIIKPNSKNKLLRLPFQIIGVKHQNVLLRISARSGIYVEDRLDFDRKLGYMEICSTVIFKEIINKHAGLDTLEVFFT